MKILGEVTTKKPKIILPKCEFYGNFCKNYNPLPNEEKEELYCFKNPLACPFYTNNLMKDAKDKDRKLPFGKPNYKLTEK